MIKPVFAFGSGHLRGKRVLVTGGTTGIGRATVALLAQHGARVITFGRHEKELADALRYSGQFGEVHGLTADSAEAAGVERVYEAVDTNLAGLDILVACAALGAQPIHGMSDHDWRYVIETNLVGYLACTRAAIERLRHAGGGQIVLVGSISAEIKAKGESVYAATKAGISAFAETLRKEVAEENIRVSVIEPGSTGTDMQECDPTEQRDLIGQHRMLRAEQVAEAILFVLTREDNCDIVSLRIEPRLQKGG
jgi:NAD(P)-dependent dehydrogenase (short-subunit alcohol dehydrogenase family)